MSTRRMMNVSMPHTFPSSSRNGWQYTEGRNIIDRGLGILLRTSSQMNETDTISADRAPFCEISTIKLILACQQQGWGGYRA